MTTTLRRGTKVEWTSQARGTTVTKRGTVLCRVPPETCPVVFQRHKGAERKCINPALKVDGKFEMNRISVNRFRGCASYLVSVANDRRGRPTVYWPRLHELRAV